MRRFLYDDTEDKTLISTLQAVNERLEDRISGLEVKLETATHSIAERDAIIANLRVEIVRLQNQPPKVVEVEKPLTPDEFARRIGVPISMIADIDTERMGIELAGGRK